MRVLFISISTVPFGPNDLLFYRAAEELIIPGHQVLVSPWDWGEQNAKQYRDLSAKGAQIHYRSRDLRPSHILIRQLAKLRHKLSDPARNWRFVERFRPDAIVVSDAATYHFLSVPVLVEFLDQAGIPYFLISQYNDENTALPLHHYMLAQKTFAKARTIFFVSQRNLKVAQRQLCQDLKNALVVDNPPNINDWGYVPYPKTKTAHFCMVARLECSVKGQALVLQVLSEQPWRERDWHLSLYGLGPDENYLRDLARYLKLEDKVRFCGFSTDLRATWAEEQLLIMASSGEGKPLALTEAMLCGRPAAVTDVAGNAELIAHNVTGFVAHSSTVAGLKEALEQAWAARGAWEQMGRRAHNAMISRLQTPPGRVVAETILSSSAPR